MDTSRRSFFGALAAVAVGAWQASRHNYNNLTAQRDAIGEDIPSEAPEAVMGTVDYGYSFRNYGYSFSVTHDELMGDGYGH